MTYLFLLIDVQLALTFPLKLRPLPRHSLIQVQLRRQCLALRPSKVHIYRRRPGREV